MNAFAKQKFNDVYNEAKQIKDAIAINRNKLMTSNGLLEFVKHNEKVNYAGDKIINCSSVMKLAARPEIQGVNLDGGFLYVDDSVAGYIKTVMNKRLMALSVQYVNRFGS